MRGLKHSNKAETICFYNFPFEEVEETLSYAIYHEITSYNRQ